MLWGSDEERSSLTEGLPANVVKRLDGAQAEFAELSTKTAAATAALEAQQVNEEQLLHAAERRLVSLRTKCEATTRDLKSSEEAKATLQRSLARDGSELVELRSFKALAERQQAKLQEAQTRALEIAERRQADVDSRDRELEQLRERCAAAEQRSVEIDVKLRESDQKHVPLDAEVMKMKQEI